MYCVPTTHPYQYTLHTSRTLWVRYLMLMLLCIHTCVCNWIDIIFKQRQCYQWIWMIDDCCCVFTFISNNNNNNNNVNKLSAWIEQQSPALYNMKFHLPCYGERWTCKKISIRPNFNNNIIDEHTDKCRLSTSYHQVLPVFSVFSLYMCNTWMSFSTFLCLDFFFGFVIFVYDRKGIDDNRNQSYQPSTLVIDYYYYYFFCFFLFCVPHIAHLIPHANIKVMSNVASHDFKNFHIFTCCLFNSTLQTWKDMLWWLWAVSDI